MQASLSIEVEKPNPQTFKFAGRFINLSELGRQNDMDPSHLSRIFRGERTPTVPYCRKISRALGITVDQFLNFLDYHNKT